ncbi:hypothetical protein EVAR_56200_1 [Eumeta japonica]|uniref:Uncharacterized protein n=1 Tax=Eumeta variegata TaxID=151549 RepID=A0A4C1Y476_EUMVA|nr:hypothetical protein EVAR_56200_1 [Eumeta japonica]
MHFDRDGSQPCGSRKNINLVPARRPQTACCRRKEKSFDMITDVSWRREYFASHPTSPSHGGAAYTGRFMFMRVRRTGMISEPRPHSILIFRIEISHFVYEMYLWQGLEKSSMTFTKVCWLDRRITKLS